MAGSNGVPINAMAKPTALESEMGVRLAGMPFSERYDNKSVVIARSGEPTVKQLVEMRRTDGQARALFRLLTMPVRAAARRATWIPSDNGDAEAEFAETMLRTPSISGGMSTPFLRVISQMLLATSDGFAPFELVYQRPRKGPLAGKFCLQKIAYRPPESVAFVVDDHGEYDGFKQRTVSPLGKYIDVKIDADKSIYYACSEDESPFYGVSFFNAAFYHYDKKVKLYYLAHLAAQHRAVGARLGKYPAGATPGQIQEFRRALADFGLAQSVTVPDQGWSVEDLGKSPGDFPFMDFINHHNSQMSKSILAPFFDDAQGGQQSLVDFGGQNESMYMVLVHVLINEIETLFSDWLVPRFVDWNFGSGNYPKLKFGPFSDEQKGAIKETFDKLSSAGSGANVTRRFLFELERYMAGEMGLDIDYKKMDRALKKQTDDTLKYFQSGFGQPLQEPPFQAIPPVPADQQPGLTPQQQPMPPFGANSLAPSGGPGTPPSGSPGGALPLPAAPSGGFPTLPSKLSALEDSVPSVMTWASPDEVVLSEADAESVDAALVDLAVV